MVEFFQAIFFAGGKKERQVAIGTEDSSAEHRLILQKTNQSMACLPECFLGNSSQQVLKHIEA